MDLGNKPQILNLIDRFNMEEKDSFKVNNLYLLFNLSDT